MTEKQSFSASVYPANRTIFDEGQAGDAAYMIVRGEIEVRKGTNTNNPRVLAVIGKGEVFGEMALFDSRPRMAAAIAKTEVELIRIEREEFKVRLKSVDPVMRSMMLFLVQRVRNMADEFMRKKDV
jgi:CRP-like cAMP-binding protein